MVGNSDVFYFTLIGPHKVDQIGPKPLKTVTDQGASNGEGFIQIEPVVSEHGLVCSDFWWFWTDLVHFGWTNQNKIQNSTVSDQGASNGEDLIKIGPVVSEHGFVCKIGPNSFGPI